MDKAITERMLLVLLESSQQRIDNVRQAICRTILQAHWEDADGLERGWAAYNRQRQFWRDYRPSFPFRRFFIA
jgi:hypothetical protein